MSRRPLTPPPASTRRAYSPSQSSSRPTFARQDSANSARYSSDQRYSYDEQSTLHQSTSRAPPSRPERSSMRRNPQTNPSSPATGRDEPRFAERDGHSRSSSNPRVFLSSSPTKDRSAGANSQDMIRSFTGSSEGVDERIAPPRVTTTGATKDKSRRMMDRLNLKAGVPSVMPTHLRTATSNSITRKRRDSADSLSSEGSSLGSAEPSPSIPAVEPIRKPSLAVTTAVSAFSKAGERRDGRRDAVAEEGVEAKIPPVRKTTAKSLALNPMKYPDTAAFREVEAVLRMIKLDWPFILQGTAEQVSQEEGMDSDYDPVALALSLLSPTSVGTPNSLPAFLRIKADLDHAISSTLASSTSSYRAYETSLTTYNTTLASLAASVKVVGNLKQGLGQAREKLEGKGKDGLVAMYNRLNHLEEMVKILDEIDHLRSIPDRLEALLSEKRFLSAVILLVRSMKMINKPDMMEIGAVSDLRGWMVQQEGILLDILIEELHNHLYLKSFYCDVRWKAYSKGQTKLPLVDFGEDLDVAAPTALLDTTFKSSGRSTARLPQQSKLQRYLSSLSLRPSHNPIFDEPIDDVSTSTTETTDFDLAGAGFSVPGLDLGDVEANKPVRTGQKNPEMDSFAYVESLLESLATLGKLGHGLDAISQRVQVEMFNLVETTLEEVDERNDTTRQGALGNRPASSFTMTSATSPAPALQQPHRGSLVSLSSLAVSNTSASRSSLLRLTASETNALEMNVETLKDLFWTLYSKLDAVLQGFRVAYEVSLRISDRRDFKDASIIKTSSGSLMFSLIEIWKPVQQEVRSLLHDYLTDDQSGTVSSRNPIVSVNEVLRAAKTNRDHSKQIFKFADSDLKASSKALKHHEDELNRALKFAVPGLMLDGPSAPGQIVVSAATNADGSYPGGLVAGSSRGGTHKALVSADSFNVSVLFGPTLAFLERVKEIMPGGSMGEYDTSSGFAGFLDDFVLRTFLPQLEEKVTSVFHQAVGGNDAFQEDPNYKKFSPVPIVKSVSNLMLLISSLCSMLRSTPFHRENYSNLIVGVIHQFYQRCNDRFKDLASRDQAEMTNTQGRSSSLKTAAEWAEAPEVNECMAEIRRIAPTDKARMREALKRETKIQLEKKGLAPIATEDLISAPKKLLALGTLYASLNWFIIHVSSLKTTSEESSIDRAAMGNDDTTSNGLGEEGEDSFSLPLTQEMTQPFEALLKSYQQLADTILFTLRLEVRLRTMHFLDKATRDGIYQLSEDIAEPDASVVDLNSNLAECDECAATTLAPPERRFVFEGLSLLMDQLLISNSRYIRLANQHGLTKMYRNILALQQNLKNIGEEPLEVDFDRSRKFWEIFGKGPKAMLESIKSKEVSYDFEDYKSLLNLQCGIDQSSTDTESALDASSNSAGLNSANGGEAGRSRRIYNEYLIELFALD